MTEKPALTDQAFWDQWWKKTALPVQPDARLPYDRVFMDFFERHLSLGPGSRVMEVGCAPGKWLVYFHKKFGSQVAGCEMSPLGLKALHENLKAASVPARVMEGDFLALDPAGDRFDAVLSLGFIEHFTDPMEVARKHAEFLAPGGLLVLGVPNFRGFNKYLQDPNLLGRHNLSVMKKDFFREAARRFSLRPRFLDYVGGYEPANLNSRGRPLGLRALAWAMARLPLLRRFDSPLWSGFLLGVFEKPGGAASLFRD